MSKLQGAASRRTLVAVPQVVSSRRDADRCSRDARAPHANNPSFMESEHLPNADVSWGHEPEMHKPLEFNERILRFMGSAGIRAHESARPGLGDLRGSTG